MIPHIYLQVKLFFLLDILLPLCYNVRNPRAAWEAVDKGLVARDIDALKNESRPLETRTNQGPRHSPIRLIAN